MYFLPTSDVPVLCQACDAEQVSSLSLAGWQCLTPSEDGVEVELVTWMKLLVWLPETLTAEICEKSCDFKGSRRFDVHMAAGLKQSQIHSDIILICIVGEEADYSLQLEANMTKCNNSALCPS